MDGLRPKSLREMRRKIRIIRGRVSHSEEQTPQGQIDAYLRGDADVFLEVDLWIRTQLRAQYPALLDEEEDLCQMVHQKLLVNLREGRFRGQSNLRSYVGGITNYSAIDRLRVRYRDREFQEEAEAELPQQATDNPYREAEQKDEAKLLHRLVMAMPQACRELWRLVFVEKLSYVQIGEELTIPPGTVKSRMWHCRRKAMEILRRLRVGLSGDED